MTLNLPATVPAAPTAVATPLNALSAALLPFLLTVLAAFQAIPATNYTWPVIVTFIGFVLTNAGVYFVPLLEGPWKAGFKVAVALGGGLVSALVPALIANQWNAAVIVGLFIAVLNALAAELGVGLRTRSAKVEQQKIDATITAGVYNVSTLPPATAALGD